MQQHHSFFRLREALCQPTSTDNLSKSLQLAFRQGSCVTSNTVSCHSRNTNSLTLPSIKEITEQPPHARLLGSLDHPRIRFSQRSPQGSDRRCFLTPLIFLQQGASQTWRTDDQQQGRTHAPLEERQFARYVSNFLISTSYQTARHAVTTPSSLPLSLPPSSPHISAKKQCSARA